jgi:putative lipoic acid-binding regulatory protein
VTQPLKFPTEFPIKVMGRRDSDLKTLTREIIELTACSAVLMAL